MMTPRRQPYVRWRWTKRSILVAFLCVIVIFLLLSRKGLFRGFDAERVVRVIDGDTIELADGRKVRYIGIDTPETGDPGADSATALNTALVLNKSVRLEYGREKLDRYGRTLAIVYADRRMVNLEILNAGWACCYFFQNNLNHARELVLALDGAMENHRGLWKSPHPETADHYVASESGFRFHRPDCPNVADIRRNATLTFTVRDSAIYHGFSPCRNCKP